MVYQYQANERKAEQYEVMIKGANDTIISSCLITLYNNGKANVLIVDNVFTNEAFRGQGFGKKLMKYIDLIARLNKVDAIELLVNKDNTIAKNLYFNEDFNYVSSKECWRKILNRF